jgi:hypothetical protein
MDSQTSPATKPKTPPKFPADLRGKLLDMYREDILQLERHGSGSVYLAEWNVTPCHCPFGKPRIPTAVTSHLAQA